MSLVSLLRSPNDPAAYHNSYCKKCYSSVAFSSGLLKELP